MSYCCLRTLFIVLCLISGYSSSSSVANESDNSSCQEITARYYDLCPTWFVPRLKKHGNSVTVSCECGPHRTTVQGVQCDQFGNNTYISRSVCMTFDNKKNITYAGRCPYNTHQRIMQNSLVLLPNKTAELNDFMCGRLNRTGLLCSQCQDGLGPAVLSYKRECVKCLDSRYGWLLYVVLTVLPTTLLCVVIIITRFDANSPSMKLFIIVCQTLTILFTLQPFVALNSSAIDTLFSILITFYGFWNLDFFRYLIPPFCISSQMNTLQVIALDYTVAVYPLLLTAVVYYCIEFHDRGNRVLMWMWRPFQRCFICIRKTWDIKGSIVNTFATFVLLSTSKFAAISSRLLFPEGLLTVCNEKLSHRVLYGDPSIRYLSTEHLPLVIIAIFALITFTVFRAIFLLLYQTSLFQKCLGCLRLRLTLLHELTRVCQRHYKDGTDGTRDYRWFAGVYILLHTTSLITMGINVLSSFLAILVSLLASSLFIIIQPYRKMVYNKLYSLYFIVAAMVIAWTRYLKFLSSLPYWPIICLLCLPFLLFAVYCTYKLLINNKKIRKLAKYAYSNVLKCIKKCIKSGRHGNDEGDENSFQFSHRLLHSLEYSPNECSHAISNL